MKKLYDFATIIFLLTLPLFLFLNATQAKAQCNIVWWGDESGSVPTTETSVTETATYEAFFAIFGLAPSSCREDADIDGYFCSTFSLTVPTPSSRVVSLDQKCWSDGSFNIYNRCEATGEFGVDGEWDVVCSDPCEASGGDSDFDDICDDVDNCPDIANPGQEDADSDGIGDVCDDEDVIDLKDYDLCIWDFSGTYNESRDGMTLNFTLIQDSKGKVTGSGTFNDQSDGNDMPIDVDIKGKVKGKNNIVSLKYKAKGKNADGNMLKDDVSLVLDECILPLMGTEKRKICQRGGGCEKTEASVSLDVPDGMTGEAVLSIDTTSDEKGKKHKGTGELVLSNGDIYNLNTKGKYNSNQEETQYQIKGVGASTKGIKFKLKIDEESDNATFIRGKALGQQLKY